MKLDNEQDRQLLLGMISQSTLPGTAVKVVADLVQRIERAGIDETQDAGQTRAVSGGEGSAELATI